MNADDDPHFEPNLSQSYEYSERRIRTTTRRHGNCPSSCRLMKPVAAGIETVWHGEEPEAVVFARIRTGANRDDDPSRVVSRSYVSSIRGRDRVPYAEQQQFTGLSRRQPKTG
jgi:hypothetical protein